MQEVGLIHPIVIQRHNASGRIYLVAGRNRVQAAVELKWGAIDAIEIEDRDGGESALQSAKLSEIAENLHCREIDELERAELVAAWAELVRQRRVISAHDGQKSKTALNPKGAGRGHGGISQTARDLGMKRQTVERHLTVVSLSPEATARWRLQGHPRSLCAFCCDRAHEGSICFNEPFHRPVALDNSDYVLGKRNVVLDLDHIAIENQEHTGRGPAGALVALLEWMVFRDSKAQDTGEGKNVPLLPIMPVVRSATDGTAKKGLVTD